MQKQFDTTTKSWANALKWPLLGGFVLIFFAKILPFLVTLITNVFTLVLMLIPLVVLGWFIFSDSGRSIVNSVYLTVIRWMVHNVLNPGALIQNHIKYLEKKERVYKKNVSVVKTQLEDMKAKRDAYTCQWEDSLNSIKTLHALIKNTSNAEDKRKYTIKLQTESNNAESLENQAKLFDNLYRQLKNMHDKMTLIGEYLAPLVVEWTRKYDRLLDRQKALKSAAVAASAGNAVLGDQKDFMTQFAIETIEEDIVNQSAIIDVFIQDASSYVEGKMTSQASKVRDLMSTLEGTEPEVLISSFISKSDAEIKQAASEYDDLLNLTLN